MGTNRYGFIDKTGKEVIPAKLKWASSFSNGIAVIEVEHGRGAYRHKFIDKTGEEILTTLKYGYSHGFSGGFASGEYYGKYGIFDTTGEDVVPPLYDSVSLFVSEGTVAVAIGGMLEDIEKRTADGSRTISFHGKWGFVALGGTTAGGGHLDAASAWARDGITSAIAKGFVPADMQGGYKNVISRAEFCRLAVKFVEYKKGKTIDEVLLENGLSRDIEAFSDTSSPAILAAFALGVTNGTGDGKFTPDGQFTREQAAAMLQNTCRVLGMDAEGSLAPAGFSDMNQASSWALAGIGFCRANGIMNGVGENRFDPKGAYTREQSILTFDNIK